MERYRHTEHIKENSLKKKIDKNLLLKKKKIINATE